LVFIHFVRCFLDIDKKHIAGIFAIMTTSFPEVDIEHIRSNDLFIASNLILLLDQMNKVIINKSARWIEECTTRSLLIEEE